VRACVRACVCGMLD